MRFIDLDLLIRREGVHALIDEAEAARVQILEAADPNTRKALIAAHRDKWVAFRDHFESVFGCKCWYTESTNPGTDDDIDHFRPKGKLTGLPKDQPAHDGYWWEALNWRNFRLSSHRANRPRQNPETGKTHGKGAHFPLVDEAKRWRGPEESCCERPSLLDPTDPADPPHLTFDQDGRVALSPYYRDDEVAALRVEQSRIYLHLDWPAFVHDRRDLYALIYIKVHEGDEADRRFSRAEAGAKDALSRVAADLIRLTRDKEPYSRAAQAYIYRFRDRDWVRRFVIPHVPAPSGIDHA